MATSGSTSMMSVGKLIAISVIVSALAGGLAGFGVGMLGRPSVAPQVRDFYVFESELPFDPAVGGVPHYVYTADRIVVNKGDTVKIHFYDITDEGHTFTMNDPYANDAVLAAATNTTIDSKTITFVAGVSGIFPYFCRFHPPTMAGTLVVLA